MYSFFLKENNKGFTLIELLVVIAIVAILMVTVVVTINPGQLLAQARDSNRLSDLNTINTAINLSRVDSIALGSSTITYISIPDPTAPIGGNQCQGLGLPPLPSPYTYHCSASSTYRKVDGTGWIPINFTQMSSGAPFSQIPIDPVNQTSSYLFYTYTTDGSTYEITGITESQKYKNKIETNPQNPLFPGVVEQGSNLALSELYNSNGLVGYWPLNEGTGSIAIDQSGNNNNGTWSGTPSSPNSTYYGAGKIGNYAGWFDGNTDYIQAGSASFSANNGHTLSIWINPNTLGVGLSIVMSFSLPYIGIYNNNNGVAFVSAYINNTQISVSGGSISSKNWYFIVETYDNTNLKVYVNGILTGSISSPGIENNFGNLFIGKHQSGAYFFNGLINDVRVYNRALSPAEIQAIYNAQK